MKITDTCKCGATFTLDEKRPLVAQTTFLAWLNAHVPCRGGGHITNLKWHEK